MMNYFPLAAGLLVCLLGGGGCGMQKPPAAVSAPQQASATTEKVCSIAAELLVADRSQVHGQTSLADLGADELDFVELIMELEETFDISIPDETAERLLGTQDWEQGMKNVTLAKLAGLVEQQQKAARQEK